MRCSARRRRAAATISIARVIFWMFWTERDPVLDVALAHAASGLLLGPARPHRASPASVGRAGAVGAGAHGRAARRRAVERLALLVEVVAEVLGELGDDLLDTPPGSRRTSRRPRSSSSRSLCLGVQALGQRRRGTRGRGRRDAVEEAVGGGVDLDDLVLDRQRRALVLVQRARPGARRGPASAGCRGRGRSRTGRTPRGRGTARARSSGGRRPSSSARSARCRPRATPRCRR